MELDLLGEVDIPQIYTTVDDVAESDLEAGKKLACKVPLLVLITGLLLANALAGICGCG